MGHKGKKEEGKTPQLFSSRRHQSSAVLQGQDFQKKPLAFGRTQGRARSRLRRAPQPRLRSARSTVPAPSAQSEIKSAGPAEPPPKTLCGGLGGQLDFLSKRGLRSHPKTPLAITEATNWGQFDLRFCFSLCWLLDAEPRRSLRSDGPHRSPTFDLPYSQFISAQE